jgi:hypothetical protein
MASEDDKEHSSVALACFLLSRFSRLTKCQLSPEPRVIEMSNTISWIAYLWLLTVESLEEVFESLFAVRSLQRRFDYDNSSQLLHQAGLRAQGKEVI